MFLFYCISTKGQVAVSAELDTTTMLIGDQIQLHLLVNHVPGVEVRNPDLKDLEKSGIEVLSVNEWDTLQRGNEFVLQKNVTFTAWDSGYVWIPKIAFPYQQNNDKGIVSTNELPLVVLTPTIDTTLAPIKTIIEEPITLEDFYVYILVFSIVLLLGIIGFIFWKRNQRKEKPDVLEIILPPHEIAFQKLESLKNEKLWQQGSIKKYQSELTFIVREYLENRYGIQALESTTDEIIDQLKEIEIEENLKIELRKMLQTADLVKFAKAEPPITIHNEVMEQAEHFVRVTKIKEIIIEDSLNAEESQS